MKRSLGAAVILLATAVPAWAQVYVPPQTNPYARPPLSPYLNLFRGGLPAINYYGLVRPQQQAFGQLQALQQEVQTQAALGAAADGRGTPLSTGVAARFGNYSHYYSGIGLSQGSVTLPPLQARPLQTPPLVTPPAVVGGFRRPLP